MRALLSGIGFFLMTPLATMAEAFAAPASGGLVERAIGDLRGSAFVEAVAGTLADLYMRSPAMVLSLLLLAAGPVLLVAGGVIRLAGAARPRPLGTGAKPHRRAPAWPSDAWIEVGDARAAHRVVIGHGLLRIGREPDNDVCLSDDSVHRYHAAIHRSEDASVLVTDLSSGDGNGVVLNGRRVGVAKLRNGDTLQLGKARLSYIARPVAIDIMRPATPEAMH